jgi:hypothetical protein
MRHPRDDTTTPPKREKRSETGVQRALANVADVKRHLRNADAHLSRARSERHTAA